MPFLFLILNFKSILYVILLVFYCVALKKNKYSNKYKLQITFYYILTYINKCG